MKIIDTQSEPQIGKVGIRRCGDGRTQSTSLGQLSNSDLLSVLELSQESLKCDKNSLSGFLAKLGSQFLPHSVILATHVQDTGSTKSPTYNLINLSYPAEWLDEYIQKDYFAVDPIKKHLLKPGDSNLCNWSDALRADDNADSRGFIRRLRDHELGEGLTFCHKQAGSRAMSFFSFGGQEIASDSRSQTVLRYMLPYLHEAFVRNHKTSSIAQDCKELTPREKDVLSWAMYGKTNGDIAELLNISERTVKFHIQNVLCKLNASSRAHAVTIALHMGLINA
jgi:DNA-binding CsgD family transcriptional regulator